MAAHGDSSIKREVPLKEKATSITSINRIEASIVSMHQNDQCDAHQYD